MWWEPESTEVSSLLNLLVRIVVAASAAFLLSTVDMGCVDVRNESVRREFVRSKTVSSEYAIVSVRIIWERSRRENER